MIYGLYMSAAGMKANSRRIDILTNNLANSDTSGFKRDLAVFQNRATAAQQRGGTASRMTDPVLENLGGGVGLARTEVDLTGGELEGTGNDLDFALQGRGFFAVQQGKDVRLTRDGRFSVNQQGMLVLSSGGQWVLDQNRQPIMVKREVQIEVAADGTLSQNSEAMGKLGVFDVPSATVLSKTGQGLFTAADLPRQMSAGEATVTNGVLERSNAEPITELARLIDAQRSLEANANMIRCQDQTLDRLVNNVGKVS
jgi:flagellar basal-body rod protein FlgF